MSVQRVVILSNASSGRGRAPGLLVSLRDRFAACGYEVGCVTAGPGNDPALLCRELANASALIVAGGDGTVHHSLERAIDAGVPVYHLPSGNENLFAREFGMDGSWERLQLALSAGGTRTIDLGSCNGKLFALMVSVGIDASIVERVSRSRHGRKRNGGVTHTDYALQGLRELVGHRPPRLRVAVDNETVVENQQGLVVVANSRQYGGGLDPARDARVDDGLLNVVFFPASNRAAIAGWAARLAWTRGLSRTPSSARAYRKIGGALHAAGKHIAIHQLEGTSAAQVDGEFLGRLGAGGLEALDIQVRPSVLTVLGSPGSLSGSAMGQRRACEPSPMLR